MPCERCAVPLAVLDTNIVVSALMHPGGPPGQVMAAVMRGDLTPVLSRTIVAEYREVLCRPRLHLDPAKVDLVLATLLAIGTWLPDNALAPPPADLPDAGDWPFMACALAAGCPVVTGNLKHFPPRMGVAVMTARAWVELGTPKAPGR